MDFVFIGLVLATIVCILLTAYSDIFQIGVSAILLTVLFFGRFILSKVLTVTDIVRNEQIMTQAICIAIPLVQLLTSPIKVAVILVCVLIGYSFYMGYLKCQLISIIYNQYKQDSVYCFATVLNMIGVVMSVIALRQFGDILWNALDMLISLFSNTYDLPCFLKVGQSIIAFDWLFSIFSQWFPKHKKEIKIARIILSFAILELLLGFSDKPLANITIETWRIYFLAAINVAQSYYLDPVRVFKELQWKEIMPKFYVWCRSLVIEKIDIHIREATSLPECVKQLWYFLCGYDEYGQKNDEGQEVDLIDVGLQYSLDSKTITADLSLWWSQPSTFSLVNMLITNGKRISGLLNSYKQCQEWWIRVTPQLQTFFLIVARVFILFFMYKTHQYNTFNNYVKYFIVIVVLFIIAFCLDLIIQQVISAVYCSVFVRAFKDELGLCTNGINAMVNILELIGTNQFVFSNLKKKESSERKMVNSFRLFVSIFIKYNK